MEKIFDGIEITDDLKLELQKRFANELTEKEKLATINANRILDSVADNFEKKYGVKRLATETKITEYIERATQELGLQSLKKSEYILTEKEKKINELEQKINAGITDEKFKSEYENLKTKFGSLNEVLEEKNKEVENIKNDYETKLTEYKVNSKLEMSMPDFDKDLNKFELDYRKSEAIKKLKENYELKLNENNELIATHKETLISKKANLLLSEMLKDYLQKDKQNGGGATPPTNNMKTLNVPNGLNLAEKAALIESHLLATKYKNKTEEGYVMDFNKLLKENQN